MSESFVKNEKGKYNKDKNRFDLYDPRKSVVNVEECGLVNSDSHYDLGVPNLSRNENITLISSNSSRDSVWINIKWRPIESQHVQLFTEFKLELNGNIYKHSQLCIYKPTKSNVRRNRILQYGGPKSNLKLIILAPYRRLRFLFTGYMQNNDPAFKDDVKFIKCNFLVLPCAAVFDFFDEFDKIFLKKQFKKQSVKWPGGFKSSLQDVASHDRHEQMVSVKGECLYRDLNDSEVKSRQFYTWGFHIREFPLEIDDERRIWRKSVFVYTIDGRAFCLAQLMPNNKSFQYQTGYTAFYPKRQTIPISVDYEIDWNKLYESEFSIQVSGQKKSFTCKVKSSSNKFSFHKEVNFNGVSAFGFISSSSDVDWLDQNNAFVQEYRSKFLNNLKNGNIKPSYEPKVDENNKSKLLVVSLFEEECCSSDLVGSKVASLAHLLLFKEIAKSNFKVPNGIVLTRYAYDMINLENEAIRTNVLELERIASENDQILLKQQCDRLERLVSAMKLPLKLREEVASRLDENRLNDISFAVRSSSWGEDEEDMSAAGQLKTMLFKRGLDEICSSIMACFASKFNYANIQYKRQHGLPLDLPMAVIVQEMVSCEKAGVMFTCDPTNGDERSILITANYGLGETVVSGQADPDSIKVYRGWDGEKFTNQLKIEQISVGSKCVIMNAPGSSELTSTDKSRCCLSNDEIMKLANCGLELVEYFQSHRDLEWGFFEDQLYLLQSRPVTGLETFTEFELMHEGDRVSRAEYDFFTRANLGEVLPYALTPMTISHNLKAWSVYSNRFEKIWAPNVKMSSESFADFLIDSYHTFLPLRSSPLMGFRKANGELHKFGRAFQVAFFGHEIEADEEFIKSSEESMEKKPIKVVMLVIKLITADLRLMGKRMVTSHNLEIKRLREKYLREAKNDILDNKDYNEVTKMTKLFKLLGEVCEDGSKCWKNHGLTIVVSSEYNGNMISLLSKYIKDQSKIYSLIGKFMALSEQSVVSGEIPERINKISKLIKEKGDQEKFTQFNFKEAIKYLEETHLDVSKEYKKFLELFGHRCYNEFDVSSKSWAREANPIVEMIRKNCESSETKAQLRELKEMQRKTVESFESIINSSGIQMSLIDKMRLKYMMVPDCQRFVSIREQTKDNFIAQVDIMRELGRLLAHQLCKNLRIPDEELFFYLFLDELEPIIREPQPSIVVQALRRRNMFRKNFKYPWKFDEIIHDYKCLPNHLKPSVEVEEKLAKAAKLYGTVASCGWVQGKVCLVENYEQLNKVKAGDILLAHSTDIAFSPIFPLVGGIITEVGGLISHGAVVAREYGLPSIIGVPDITRIVKDGEEIILDANKGVIIRLSIVEQSANGISELNNNETNNNNQKTATKLSISS